MKIHQSAAVTQESNIFWKLQKIPPVPRNYGTTISRSLWHYQSVQCSGKQKTLRSADLETSVLYVYLVFVFFATTFLSLTFFSWLPSTLGTERNFIKAVSWHRTDLICSAVPSGSGGDWKVKWSKKAIYLVEVSVPVNTNWCLRRFSGSCWSCETSSGIVDTFTRMENVNGSSEKEVRVWCDGWWVSPPQWDFKLLG